MYAAPFEDTSINNNEKEEIYKKKQNHNKTQKKYPKEEINHDRVNSVLQSIHQHSSGEEDEENLGDFYPPPKPQSSGVSKTIATEQMLNMNNNLLTKSLGLQPQPNYGDVSDNLELNNFSSTYDDTKTREDYYKKFIPNYPSSKNNNNYKHNPPNQKNYYSGNDYFYGNKINENSGENEMLLQKINYMINLLEEKQDEKTTNVTEEIILYSFLGIFIIFIVDSFTRVGKYVR